MKYYRSVNVLTVRHEVSTQQCDDPVDSRAVKTSHSRCKLQWNDHWWCCQGQNKTAWPTTVTHCSVKSFLVIFFAYIMHTHFSGILSARALSTIAPAVDFNGPLSRQLWRAWLQWLEENRIIYQWRRISNLGLLVVRNVMALDCSSELAW